MLEATYQTLLEHANQHVIHTKEPTRFKVCTLFPTGFVYIGILHKVPLVDRRKQVKAIFSFSEEWTAYMDLVSLYQVYKKHYPAAQAILQFLNYLKIKLYFHTLPTSQELLALFVLSQNPHAKYVASQLRLSPRTVEEYKARLRDKLRVTFSLERLLVTLRHSVLTLNRSSHIDDIPCFIGKH